MKEEIKDLWVNALRSGKYKQCQNQLKDHTGNYCCLGVLSEISGLNYMHNDGGLNHAIREWAGIDFKNGSGNLRPQGSEDPFHSGAPYESLVRLNDGKSPNLPFAHSLNFDEIADVIEMTWEEL